MDLMVFKIPRFAKVLFIQGRWSLSELPSGSPLITDLLSEICFVSYHNFRGLTSSLKNVHSGPQWIWAYPWTVRLNYSSVRDPLGFYSQKWLLLPWAHSDLVEIRSGQLHWDLKISGWGECGRIELSHHWYFWYRHHRPDDKNRR